MKSFREYLQETIDNTRSHFTSFDSLVDILESGFLQGKKYYGSKMDIDTVSNWEKYKDNHEGGIDELCLVRSGKKHAIKQIACHRPEAEIVFDWNNILNLRNIRKPYPIAEYGLRPFRSVASFLKYYTSNNYISKQEADKAYSLFKKKNKTKEEVDGFMNSLQSNQSLKRELSVSDPAFIPEKDFEKLIADKKEKDRLQEKRSMIRNIEGYLVNSNSLSSIREGEERIDLSKNKIPVNSKYIKIIIPKDFRKKTCRHNVSVIEQYMKKDPNLFEFKDQ